MGSVHRLPRILALLILGNLLFHFVPLLSHELKLPHRFVFFGED